jgi:hypothetical protein
MALRDEICFTLFDDPMPAAYYLEDCVVHIANEGSANNLTGCLIVGDDVTVRATCKHCVVYGRRVHVERITGVPAEDRGIVIVGSTTSREMNPFTIGYTNIGTTYAPDVEDTDTNWLAMCAIKWLRRSTEYYRSNNRTSAYMYDSFSSPTKELKMECGEVRAAVGANLRAHSSLHACNGVVGIGNVINCTDLKFISGRYNEVRGYVNRTVGEYNHSFNPMTRSRGISFEPPSRETTNAISYIFQRRGIHAMLPLSETLFTVGPPIAIAAPATAAAPAVPRLNESQDEACDEDDPEACIVCCERKRKAVAVPCGHRVMCASCANQATEHKSECSVCRQTVTSHVVMIDS